ncbi:MAG: hypothetical protein K1X66_02365 [Verrucomicrobiae bacterium]|nr:hypothetical protein [Verrucomicrobiae bacterium]
MANVTQDDVVVNNSYELGTRSEKFVGKFIEAAITLNGAGSGLVDEKIPAEVLGLTKIWEVSNGLLDDGGTSIIVAAPNADGSEILLRDDSTNAAFSYTGELKINVRGY